MGTRHIIGWEKNQPCSCTFTIGSVGATMAVQIVLKDYQGKTLTAKGVVRMYYSTDAAGLTVEEIGAANVVATNGIIIEDLTKWSATGISTAAGLLGMTLNGDGATSTYLNIIFPNGTVQTSTVIAFDA